MNLPSTNLNYESLLEFLWRNNASLGGFDEAVRKINKSALKLKIKKAFQVLEAK